jgi:hypothetical protein
VAQKEKPPPERARCLRLRSQLSIGLPVRRLLPLFERDSAGSRPRPGEKWFGSGKGPTGIAGKAPSAGGLNAEQHFEYFRPVRPGEVLTAETRPGKTWERESKRAGKLLFSDRITDLPD